jgi:aminoglycoside 6'-N-acetyltransferase
MSTPAPQARSNGPARYEFRPLAAADLGMVRRWLETPHVRAWWGDPDEQFALVSGDLDEPAMEQFIVALDGRPFGYVQAFDLVAWPDPAFADQPRGTRAIDQFIGEADMLGKSHGAGFVRAFAGRLLAAGARRVITDPDPANVRAVRAYEKAGFSRVRLVDTLDGRALLMLRDNPEPAIAP